MLTFFRKHKIEIIVFLLIVCLALFLRVYRIDEYMTFLGDEGRDALAVKRILVNYDFPLLGPVTSVGNMYLGPLYYYMMAAAMFVSWMNPVAASVMVAFVGTLAVGLMYYFARNWFGVMPAVLAALLYASSPVLIVHSRNSWNPNPAPFFALLTLFGLHLSRKYANYRYLMLSGGALAFVLQMHYLAGLMIPISILWWLREKKDAKNTKAFYTNTLFGILIFCFLMSPLVIFDIKYDFMNYRALTTFMFGQDRGVNLDSGSYITRFFDISKNKLFMRHLAFGNDVLGNLVFIVSSVIVGGWLYILIKKKLFVWSIFVILSWLFLGLLGVSFYKGEVYDHYLGFLNPVPFLILVSGFALFKRAGFLTSKLVSGILILLILGLILSNFINSPLRKAPNRQLQRTQEVSKLLIKYAEGKDFNFALIAERNYDLAYQFYLEEYDHKPKQLPFENTGQLFVVCEDKVCEPINNAKYEIAAFGWAKIEWEKEVQGVRIFKLVPNPSGN